MVGCDNDVGTAIVNTKTNRNRHDEPRCAGNAEQFRASVTAGRTSFPRA
jgi:hypothetical protein